MWYRGKSQSIDETPFQDVDIRFFVDVDIFECVYIQRIQPGILELLVNFECLPP